MPGLKSKIGHIVRECALHARRMGKPSSNRRLAVCVSNSDRGMSSGLRGYDLADELEKLGWRTLVVPKQLELGQRHRILNLERPSFVYMQQTRHPLNRPSLYPGVNCVLDIDDADFLDPRYATMIDESVRSAFGVVAGSRYIADYVRERNRRCAIAWTGAPSRQYGLPPQKISPPVVAWACSDPFGYPHEARLVADVVSSLAARRRDFQFWLIGGTDEARSESYLAPLRNSLECRALPFLPYETLLDRLEGVSIGLAPLLPDLNPYSAGKSFGKILAYLNTHVAVIASACADHSLFFRHGGNGMLAETAEEWERSIEVLLDGPERRIQMTAAAKGDYRRRLSAEAFGRQVDRTLQSWMDVSQPLAAAG